MRKLLNFILFLFLLQTPVYSQPMVAGDVSGPTTATDNSIPKFDGTTGALIQNSAVIVSDSNTMYGLTGLAVSGQGTFTQINAELNGNALTATSAISLTGDLDPDQLSGDTSDDNSIDGAIVAGLATVNFASGNISQWTNDSVYIIGAEVPANETDAVYLASDAAAIDSTSLETITFTSVVDVTSFDTWNAAGAEADPVFIASPSYVIDANSLDYISIDERGGTIIAPEEGDTAIFPMLKNAATVVSLDCIVISPTSSDAISLTFYEASNDYSSVVTIDDEIICDTDGTGISTNIYNPTIGAQNRMTVQVGTVNATNSTVSFTEWHINN